MIRSLLFVLLLGLPAWAWSAEHPLPLRDGERMVFRVGWGVFAHAGTIAISAAQEELEGLPQTRVVTETETRGFIRMIYPFEGRVDSIFDQTTGRLLAANAQTAAGRKHTHASIVFDYAAGTANYVDALRPERSTQVSIPEGFPMDLITSLVNTRAWDIQPGDQRPISVLFDDEFYELVVTAERVETIKTARGTEEALLLVPRMEGEQKGMFRRGGSVRVWLSLDEQRLPLRLEVSLPVGTATALLTEYRRPTQPATALTAHAPTRS